MNIDAQADEQPEITDDDVKRVSLAVGVSPLSIIRTLAGLPVRGHTGDRARIGVEMLRSGAAR